MPLNKTNKIMLKREYELSITTQGPTYPPSEVMDAEGNFIVIGKLNLENSKGEFCQEWGSAIVNSNSATPKFGENKPYNIIKFLNLNSLKDEGSKILYTLPLPLPCNNYPMVFAPSQHPDFSNRNSYPLHEAIIPDERSIDGRKVNAPITLSQWVKAKGNLTVTQFSFSKVGKFSFEFENLIPNSLYTVMALREKDLNPISPTRPGPLGIPNVFITDRNGRATYSATMPNPFESRDIENRNRIINVVVLWMSTQMSYGGAIGHYGLGGDIHAQLKLQAPSFMEFNTTE
jgi:hypothetical protein